jgi:hypothetical protein
VSLLPDPLSDYLLGKLEQKIIQSWVRLLFQMALSAVISFLFVAGGVLVGGGSFKVALGAGMVTVGLVLTVFFRTSPLTKGMTLVLPAEEATTELKTNFEVISKPQEKKQ